MSEIMRPLPFGALMRRALNEYARQGSVFGVSRLYRAQTGGEKLPLFDEKL